MPEPSGVSYHMQKATTVAGTAESRGADASHIVKELSAALAKPEVVALICRII